MKQPADRLLVRSQCLLLTGIVTAQTLGASNLASSLFTLTFMLTLCLWLTTVTKGIFGNDLLAVLILLVSGISVAANALMTGTAISFSYLKKLIMFWTTILCFSAMSRYRPESEDVRLIFRCNTFLACFLSGMYVFQNRNMYLLSGRVSAYLTFRFTNPNLAGVYLSAICMMEGIQASCRKKRLYRYFHAFLSILMLCFVFQTQARNAQLLFVVFLLFPLLINKERPRMNRLWAAFFALFPFAFALGYLLLIDAPPVRMMFSFLAGEGKNLDSRVEIWRFALQAFATSPIFGAYSQISSGTGLSQMHNSHLDVLASYGAPLVGLFLLFLFFALYKPSPMGRLPFRCQTGFAALLLSGIGEAMLFSGGMGIYLYAGILRMLANFGFEEEERGQ